MKWNVTTVRLINDRRLVAELPTGEKFEDEDPEILAKNLYASGIRANDVRCLGWQHVNAPSAAHKSKLFCAFRLLEAQTH